MNDGFVEQDEHLVVTGWNDQAERLFGWSAADVVGKRSQILVPERNRERYDRTLRALLAAPETGPQIHHLTALHRSGREFQIEMSLSTAPRNGGQYIVVFVRSGREVAERRVNEAAQAFRDLIDCLEDGYFEVDLKGVYTFVNDSYCRMTGAAADELLGSSFKELVRDPEKVKETRTAYIRVYETGQALKAFEHTLTRRDGTTCFVEDTVSLKRNSTGKAVGFIGIRRDCTERKVAAKQIAAAKEAAEAANLAKSEFLANMSHEIRTPMNGIIGMTELALDTELTPYQMECLSTVQSSAESLLTILNDILDFSKIESRKLELEHVPFSLNDIIAETVRPLAVRAYQKGVELITDVPPEVPVSLIGDPVRLRQVLTNLLGNAIKFTEQGHVMLSVREAPLRAGRLTLSFEIADTGIGIAEEKHRTVFDAFSQADGSTTRRFGGTGLGLAISSTLVQMMGGEISLRSAPGQGSTFAFTAGFEASRAANDLLHTKRRISTPIASSRLVRRLNVLLAEDNVVNQRVTVGLLTRRGHLVTVVSTGVEALEAMRRSVFDVVLMDVQMPEMGGFETTAAIRASERSTGRHTRIVAMTAHAMAGDRERCLAAGMDDYLAKPIEPSTLFAAVEQPLASPVGNAFEPDVLVFDRSGLLERLADDPALMKAVQKAFVADCTVRLTAIKAALNGKAPERVREEAHALKGAAANISALGLHGAARALEKAAQEGQIEALEDAWRQLKLEAERLLAVLGRDCAGHATPFSVAV